MLESNTTKDESDPFPNDDASEEPAGKNYWALILGLLCIVVVFGNVLVIASVVREKVLQNVTNFFIVSLAVADLLVAGCVMPFSVYVLMNWGMWDMPKVVCDFYIATDVICSTSSIFNLVAISIDRYLAVTSPITYSQHKGKTTRVYIFIVVCWLTSVAIGSPIMLGANPLPESENTTEISTTTTNTILSEQLNETSNLNTTNNDEAFVCAFYNPEFIIISSLGSFYIPCVIMIFLYIRIFSTLHSRAKVKKPKVKVQGPKASSNPKQNQQQNALHVKAEQEPLINGVKKSISNSNNQQPLQPQTSPSNNHQVKDQCIEGKKLDECSSNCNIIENHVNGDTLDDNPPAVPNKVHKASGPDTSLYERSRKCQQHNHLQNKASTIKASESIPLYQQQQQPQKNTKNPNTTVILKTLVTETNGSGKTKSKLIGPSTRVSSSPSSSHNKYDNPADNILLDSDNDRDANKNKIFGLISLTTKSKKRNQNQQNSNNTNVEMDKAAKKARKEEKHRNKQKDASSKEKKATQTLAIVLAVFLVCWVPFFTCNIINAICIQFHLDWYPGDTAFNVTTWLGYMNSCVNPLIYTIFNPEFRKAFKKILRIP